MASRFFPALRRCSAACWHRRSLLATISRRCGRRPPARRPARTGSAASGAPRSLSCCATDPDDLPESAGRIVPGVEVRIVDEQQRALPGGEVGELWIKSPAAMEGYLDRAAETREVLRDGWYRTGDLGAVL